VGAELEAKDAIGLPALAGEEDDRDLAVAADLAQEPEAIFAGEHDVEKNEVGRRGGELGLRPGGIRSRIDAEAIFLQTAREEVQDCRVIVDDEQFWPPRASPSAHGEAIYP